MGFMSSGARTTWVQTKHLEVKEERSALHTSEGFGNPVVTHAVGQETWRVAVRMMEKGRGLDLGSPRRQQGLSMSGKKTKTTTSKNLLTNSSGQHDLGVHKANGVL